MTAMFFKVSALFLISSQKIWIFLVQMKFKKNLNPFLLVTWNTLFFCLAWTHMWNTAFTDHCLLDFVWPKHICEILPSQITVCWFVWPEHICWILPSQITVCWILFGLNTYLEYCLHKSLSVGFCLGWTHMWNTAFTDHCLLVLQDKTSPGSYLHASHCNSALWDLGDPYMVILLD